MMNEQKAIDIASDNNVTVSIDFKYKNGGVYFKVGSYVVSKIGREWRVESSRGSFTGRRGEAIAYAVDLTLMNRIMEENLR